MAKRRAHTRPAGDPDDIGITTDTDETGAWHSLDLETQSYQAMLEAVRLDPDDEQLAEDLLKAKALMELAWLNRSLIAAAQPSIPILERDPYSRTGFMTMLLIHNVAVARAFVVRHGLHMQHGHRRKKRP